MRPGSRHGDRRHYDLLEDAFGREALERVFSRYGAGAMLACGANGCVWAMKDPERILKITRDPNEVEFAKRRMKQGAALDDVFAKVFSAEPLKKILTTERQSRVAPSKWQLVMQEVQRRSEMGRPEIGGVLVIERVYPIIPHTPLDMAFTSVADSANQVNLPWMPQNESVVADEVERRPWPDDPDWRLIGVALEKFQRLYYAAKDMNVYDVIPEAHGSNWGCRKKNFAESAVLIDFGGIPR